MPLEEETEFSIEWSKDFYIRCSYENNWVDFGFDLGGGEKDFLLEKNPCHASGKVSDVFVREARSVLVKNLQKSGYRVIDISNY